MSILFIYLSVFLIFILSLKKKPNGEQSILDKNFTDSIKNLFIFLIVLLHILNAIPYTGFLSNELLLFRKILGQACVAPFFFVSGCGIFEGYKKKGHDYNRTIIINHFLKIFVFSCLCLIPYIIYDGVVNGFKPFYLYMLSTIGLYSVGNPTWFVFAILFIYLVTWFVGIFKFKNLYLNLLLITLIIFIYIIVLSLLKVEPYWCNTILLFPIGGLFSILSKTISNILKNKVLNIVFIFAPLLIFVVLWYVLRKVNFLEPFGLTVLSLLLIISITSLSRRFTSRGKALFYFGKNSWPLYYIHLLFILIFSSFDISQSLVYILIVVSSLVAAYLYSVLFNILNKEVFNKDLIKKD